MHKPPVSQFLAAVDLFYIISFGKYISLQNNLHKILQKVRE